MRGHNNYIHMNTTLTVVETRNGYNVQVSTPQGHVIGNCSDGVLSVAQRYAEQQAIEKGATLDTMKKTFISLIN